MEDSTALAVRAEITPSIWQMVQAIAPEAHQSRLFGVNSAAQAAMIMIQGHELGLPLVASFRYVQVIQGKPSLSPQGCMALIHQHSERVEVKIEESTDEHCTVWMRRKDTGFEFRKTWTMADAQRAGVVKPDSGWLHYPSNMLMWRTLGFVADVVVPDIIGGLKRADELGADLTPDGDVIQGQWQVITAGAAQAPTVPAEVSPVVSLDELVEKHGADAVLAACGGKLPATDVEVQLAAAVLGAGGQQ